MIDYKKIRLLLGLLAGLSLNIAFAQDAGNERVQKKIMKYYNSEKYRKIHELFDAEFKRSMDEESLAYFMEYVIRDRQGKMKAAAYLKDHEGFQVYLITFEKGKLEMHLSVNDQEQISGLSFNPVSKPVVYGPDAAKSLLTNNPLKTITDRMCDSLVRDFSHTNNLVGLCIGIVKDGHKMTYGYGETQKGNNTIPDAHTLFDLASISKTFTGLLLAEAEEQKLVNPGDDIRKYLTGDYPNLVYENTPITLGQLINHTSCLPRIPSNLEDQPAYNEDDPYRNYSREMLLNNLKTIKLTARPGTKSEYSNYALALCGIILENVFHRTYAQLIGQYIAVPYGMNNTFVTVPDSLLYRTAGSYDEQNKPTPDWHLGDMAPAGGLSSTVADMLRYIETNYGERTASLKRVHTPSYEESKTQSIGYSWVITKLRNGNHLVWHNGATFGSTSFCGYIQETGVGVVILNNSGTGVDDLAIRLLKALQ